MSLVLIENTKSNEELTQEFAFNLLDLNIQRVTIEKAMGYLKKTTAPEYISERIDQILAELELLYDIRGGFRVFFDKDIQFSLDHFCCRGLSFETKTAIAGCLMDCSYVALFVTTAGQYLDKLSKDYQRQGDLISSYVVDTCGSVIAEKVADQIQSIVLETAKSMEMTITNRYSPGYCFWDVAEQHKLFSLLPNNFCGVSLTDSALMQPVKSVSGVIGLGKNVRARAYGCAFCDMEDCFLRGSKVKKNNAIETN